jgi:predicted enzyme related to lactoylglutathione lyase
MPQFHIERVEPVLRVEDMQAALRFYVDVLGFRKADWSSDEFAGIGGDGASLYLSRGDQGRGGAWVWIGVDDVEAVHRRLQERGAAILLPPTDFDWARELRVADPDGNVLRIGSEPK